MDIGEILVDRGLVTLDQIKQAARQSNGGRLDLALVELGWLAEEDSLRALGDELGMDYVDLKDAEVDPELLKKFPTSAIFRHSLLPLARHNGHVDVATSDPFALEALDELRSLSGLQLRPVLARHDDVVQLIKQCLGVGGDTVNELVSRVSDDVELLEDIDEATGELAEEAQAASVIRLVNELLVEALEVRASDVHVEPHERGLTVRYRVDGLLQVQPMPAEINQFYAAIITRLKIMARLNIAEKRLPQDGRIKIRVSGREIDVRVSVIPMLHGEGVVLRLLDKERMVFNLQSIGMPPEIERPFRDLITMPHGIVLVTGPTGSGKTTTLYGAASMKSKSPSTKIITVEDPVEYHSTGISQIQVHSRIGLTFAAGLRSILRHDPDVVLIGEIRDGETAQSAIQASLTGHLVFSTLHTNDAPGAFTRLIDMGVEPYLVASTLEGVLAQRLVRILCTKCREPYAPKSGELPPDFPEPGIDQLWRPKGCRECRGTGFSGRSGLYELLRADNTIRKLCVDRVDASRIREYAISQGMTTLRQCAWQRVISGETSVEEALRLTKGDIL